MDKRLADFYDIPNIKEYEYIVYRYCGKTVLCWKKNCGIWQANCRTMSAK